MCEIWYTNDTVIFHAKILHVSYAYVFLIIFLKLDEILALLAKQSQTPASVKKTKVIKVPVDHLFWLSLLVTSATQDLFYSVEIN